MSLTPFETRVKIASVLVDGVSIRATERLLSVHRDTIMRVGLLAGEACARLHDGRVRDLRPTLIEADEIWTYVAKKQKRVKHGDAPECGDAYVFVGMDAARKLLISYRVGKRDGETTDAFIRDLRSRVLSQPQISTDGWAPYIEAIDAHFGPEVPYAQVVKDFYSDQPTDQARHRYSPGRIRAVTKTVISGEPAWDKVSTSYVERGNLSIRTHLKRFGRLTLSYSKRLRSLEAAVSLYAGFYNFVRVHETLRVTPAMESGLTDHVWSMAELLTVALATPASPAPVTLASPQGMSAGAAKGERRGTKLGPRPPLRVIKGGLS